MRDIRQTCFDILSDSQQQLILEKHIWLVCAYLVCPNDYIMIYKYRKSFFLMQIQHQSFDQFGTALPGNFYCSSSCSARSNISTLYHSKGLELTTTSCLKNKSLRALPLKQELTCYSSIGLLKVIIIPAKNMVSSFHFRVEIQPMFSSIQRK